MIDIFMTPQSEDEFSEESLSPDAKTTSPQSADDKDGVLGLASPPVSSFSPEEDEDKPITTEVTSEVTSGANLDAGPGNSTGEKESQEEEKPSSDPPADIESQSKAPEEVLEQPSPPVQVDAC